MMYFRYTAGSGNTGSCEYDYNGMPPTVGLTGYQILEANNQDAVMQHLAEVGPLAVAVYARYVKDKVRNMECVMTVVF